MFAQELPGYGLIIEIARTVQRTYISVQRWWYTAGPEAWIVVGGIVLAFVLLWKRRR